MPGDAPSGGIERRASAGAPPSVAVERRALERRLSAIRRAFLARSAGQLRALEAITGQVSEAQRAEIVATVHRLAGAAGTFGFAAVSRVAGELEDALRRPGAMPDDGPDRVSDHLAAHLPPLALALARAAAAEGAADQSAGEAT